MTRRFRFGLYQPHLWSLGDAQRWWRACDEAGFDMIGVPDSPIFLREMFVSTTCCALSTARARIFTAVTNPVTRHPSVTAAGRAPEGFDVWWNAQIFFASSIEEAMKTTLGWSPQWLTAGTLAGKAVPEEYREALYEMNADTHDVEAVYKTPDRQRLLVERAKRLGLHDWLISRSPQLWGTPQDVAARFESYFNAGMTNWTIFVGGTEEDRFEFVDTLASDVVPRLG